MKYKKKIIPHRLRDWTCCYFRPNYLLRPCPDYCRGYYRTWHLVELQMPTQGRLEEARSHNIEFRRHNFADGYSASLGAFLNVGQEYLAIIVSTKNGYEFS